MSRYRRSWDSVVVYSMAFLFICLLYGFFIVGPKMEICRTYYKELSTWSCLLSRYGLPSERHR